MKNLIDYTKYPTEVLLLAQDILKQQEVNNGNN